MTVEWKLSDNLVLYEDAVSFMENRVDGIIKGTEKELVWLLEHPPIYTSGTSAKSKDLLNSHNLPVYDSKRGGQYTFHGPGQRSFYRDFRDHVQLHLPLLRSCLVYFRILTKV